MSVEEMPGAAVSRRLAAEHSNGYRAAEDPDPYADVPPPDDEPDGGVAERVDGYELEKEVHRQRIRARARELLAAEQAAEVMAGLPAPLTLADALARPEPAERWRITGLLPAGGNATLTALRKTGKTTATGNLLRALVDGVPFLDHFPVRPVTGRVTVLNYELPAAAMVRWLRDVDLDHPARVLLLNLRGHRLPLLADPGAQWLAEQLRQAETEVTIVDPFGRAFVSAGGVNESDNTEVLRFLARLDEIKTTAGVAELVMSVHGNRGAVEGAERSHGASALEDWPDALWRLVSDEDGQRYLSALGRDVDLGEARLDYDTATRRLWVAGGSRAQTRLGPVLAAVREFIGDDPGRSGREIEAAVDHPRKPLREALTQLVADGVVRIEPGPCGSHRHYLNDPSAPVRHSAPGALARGSDECASALYKSAHSDHSLGTSEEDDGAAHSTCRRCDQPLLLRAAGRDLCEACRLADRTDDDTEEST